MSLVRARLVVQPTQLNAGTFVLAGPLAGKRWKVDACLFFNHSPFPSSAQLLWRSNDLGTFIAFAAVRNLANGTGVRLPVDGFVLENPNALGISITGVDQMTVAVSAFELTLP